ncbi:MAG: hypothetical protein R3C10_18010 [Pirellulales bacterium]
MKFSRRVADGAAKLLLAVPLILAVSATSTAIIFLLYYVAQPEKTYADARARTTSLDHAAGCGSISVIVGALAIVAEKARLHIQRSRDHPMKTERLVIAKVVVIIGVGVVLIAGVLLTD